jgi:glyceraldehyde-3-phosphate dehydrogenase (NADP+)
MGAEEALSTLGTALCAYRQGLGHWPSMTMKHRIDCVRRFSGWLEEKRREIVTMLMWEIGKPLKECHNEVDRTIEYMERSIEALENQATFPLPGHSRIGIRYAPLGVVFCLSSYNFPMNEMLSLVIPALLMGNTVVLKPPRFGNLLYVLLAKGFQDSFPSDVINIIWGDAEISEPVMASGKIDVVAFVGSSQAAHHLLQLHPQPYRLRCCMGLEAKNPAIVLPTAQLDVAVLQSVYGALSLNGQRCTALKIFFVHRSIAEEFIQKLVSVIENLAFGMPWEKDVFLTPIPDADRIEYLHELLEDAIDRGAGVLNESGGAIKGSFMYPAVVYPTQKTMRLYREEQFGPLIPIVPYDDLEEVITYVMNSEYSQQVSIFCGQSFPEELVKHLENQVCRININTICQRGPDHLPFAARKNSGVGVRSVVDSLYAFSLPSFVTGSIGVTRHIQKGE